MGNITFSAIVVMATSLAAFGGDVAVGLQGDFKTPEAALAWIRQRRASGEMSPGRRVVVDVEAGTYRLDDALRFGSDLGNVVFRGPATGKAVFSGGRDLGPFTSCKDGIWRLKVPDGLAFEQLWVGGCRATRAKSPNDGYFHIMQQVGDMADPYTGKSVDGFFRAFVMREKGALIPFAGKGLDEMTNVVFRIYWSWDVDIARLRHADPDTGRVMLNSIAKRNFFRWPKYETRFTLENYRAALDAPGEWYLDRKAGELLYLPRPEDRVETAHAEVPLLKRLVEVTVDNVCFERIVFAHTAAETWAGTQHPAQSAQSLTDAAITFSNAVGCVMRDCEIRATSGYGVQLLEYAHSNVVERSHLHDLGAGGVRIGGVSWKSGMTVDRVASFNVVDNCMIHEGGRLYPEGTGVLLCQARDCRVTNNEICDLFYSGVCAGWSWGYGATPTRRNLIADNHIHHLGKGVLSDLAGVYTLGDSKGTVIRGNHIHDVINYGYTGSGSEGTYMDEGSAGIVVEENFIHDIAGASMHQNYGRDNVFRNNLLIRDNGSARPAIRRMGGSITASNNVVVLSGASLATAAANASGRPQDECRFESNLYWFREGVPDGAFSGMSWADWQRSGQDGGSVCTDPLFVNAATGDYRLLPKSPAFAVGFKPFDLDKSGVYGDAAWQALARSIRISPVKPVIPPERYGGVREYACDYEMSKPGTSPNMPLSIIGSCPRGLVRVTNRMSHSGRKSLELCEGPARTMGIKDREYNPHVNAIVDYVKDELRVSFALRYEPESDIEFLFRQLNTASGRRHVTAGGLRMSAERGIELSARGKAVRLAESKPGEWLNLSFVMRPAREGNPASWDISLRTTKGEVIGRTGLGVRDSECVRPDWIGFLSHGKPESCFWIDDVRINK